MRHIRYSTHVVLAAIVAGVTVLSACGLSFSAGAEAHDQWKRTYTVSRGGTLEIRNTNGRTTVESVEGLTSIEVVADRTVRASTDQAAKDALSRFEIAETTSADRVTIDSTKRGGMMFSMSQKVDYHVRVPRETNITLDATNGEIDVTGITGTLKIETTNGDIKARALGSSASVETTNGTVDLDFAKLGSEGVSCETTNGTIEVTVPRDTKADLSAHVVNGDISTDGLEVSTTEQSRRRLDGSINGGGAKIRLETVNGAIRVRGRER